jgi:hypothetical protein
MIQYFPIVTGSLTVLGNISVSGSITTSGSITISGSITSASFATSASNATNAISASYANNLTVAGTLTAQTLVVQTITSSVDFVTGSTRFGSLSSDTHVFTGSMLVTGSITSNGNYLSPTGQIRLYNVANNNWTQIDSPKLSGDAAIDFRLSTRLGTFYISDTGTVGIGTTSPAGLLHISGAQAGVSGKNLTISYNGTYYAEYTEKSITAFNNELIFGTGTGGTEKMRITGTGNIGINTTNPGYKLELSGSLGNFQLPSSGAEMFFTRNENNDILATGGTSSGIRIGAGGQVRFGVGASYTEVMRVANVNSGEVYIGSSTTDKNGRLVVYGQSSDGNYYTFRCYSAGSDILFGVRTDGAIISGTFTSSPYNLIRSGRVMMVDAGGVVGYQSSTRESKTNINNLTDISFLYQLNPVSFNYRKMDGISNIFTDEYNEDLHYGLIADEVETVNKELVFYNEKNGQKEVAGVEYGKLTAVLVKAIQELNTKFEEYKATHP